MHFYLFYQKKKKSDCPENVRTYSKKYREQKNNIAGKCHKNIPIEDGGAL